MRKIREVLRLYHGAGLSVRAIARSVKASPSTVGENIRRAEVQGLSWPLPPSLDDGEFEHRLFPAPAPSGTRRPLPGWGETDPTFPRPIHLTPRAPRRREVEIDAWIDSKAQPRAA